MKQTNSVDLRRWERQNLALPVSVASKAKDVPSDSTAVTLNVSLSGISILTQLILVRGQEVEVVIKGNFSQTIPARVVWVRKDPFGYRATAGLKFLSRSLKWAA